ncbi:MAG: hypothetical protein ACLPX5_12495 [Dissulfurispiraceae bacterium]
MKWLIQFFRSSKYPAHLRINGREKLSTGSFHCQDKLYRSFDSDDVDEDGRIKLDRIQSNDISCNWSKFSYPSDVRFRENGKLTDGCYSFTVMVSRYEHMATPVHDPLDDKKFPNYSHVEIRRLRKEEDIYFEPPKGRKPGSKSDRVRYRANLRNHLVIEIELEVK